MSDYIINTQISMDISNSPESSFMPNPPLSCLLRQPPLRLFSPKMSFPCSKTSYKQNHTAYEYILLCLASFARYSSMQLHISVSPFFSLLNSSPLYT